MQTFKGDSMTTFHSFPDKHVADYLCSILNTRWYCDAIFYVESCGECHTIRSKECALEIERAVCTFIAGFFAGRAFKELT